MGDEAIRFVSSDERAVGASVIRYLIEKGC